MGEIISIGSGVRKILDICEAREAIDNMELTDAVRSDDAGGEMVVSRIHSSASSGFGILAISSCPSSPGWSNRG